MKFHLEINVYDALLLFILGRCGLDRAFIRGNVGFAVSQIINEHLARGVRFFHVIEYISTVFHVLTERNTPDH